MVALLQPISILIDGPVAYDDFPDPKARSGNFRWASAGSVRETDPWNAAHLQSSFKQLVDDRREVAAGSFRNPDHSRIDIFQEPDRALSMHLGRTCRTGNTVHCSFCRWLVAEATFELNFFFHSRLELGFYFVEIFSFDDYTVIMYSVEWRNYEKIVAEKGLIDSCIRLLAKVIRSFGDAATEDVFNGRNTRASRRLPQNLWRVVQPKLDMLNAAHVLNDLCSPPGNRLEVLKGARAGKYRIRVNDQFRITFRFETGDAYDVVCEDYH